MAHKCKHIIRCCLKQTDDGHRREDYCALCDLKAPCQHFKLQKQTIRYGRDRFKPQAIVEDFELSDLDFELE
jgi:hypothetical protein